ncbi:MAG: nucleoside hydrolase, partial [Kamptonema sp. SIO4C4]|nr:nucleoside hydrolase [Kamptonema sp. SIO4C4]
GNVSAEQTFRAASQVLQLTGLSVSLGKGVTVPQKRLSDAAHIHGEDGMGNLSQTLPRATHSFADAPFSDTLLMELLQQYPHEITLVAIAPLNNLAATEQNSPGILRLAKELVIMGGAFQTPGNVTPCAEFNMAFYPEAAEIVFASREDIVILPLDVTRQLVLTEDILQSITQVNPTHPLAQLITTLGDFLITTSRRYRETDGKKGFLVHDAVAIAYLFYPELLQFQRARVQVETQGKHTFGQTFIDGRHSPKLTANGWVASSVNARGLFACLSEDLKTSLQ